MENLWICWSPLTKDRVSLVIKWRTTNTLTKWGPIPQVGNFVEIMTMVIVSPLKWAYSLIKWPLNGLQTGVNNHLHPLGKTTSKWRKIHGFFGSSQKRIPLDLTSLTSFWGSLHVPWSKLLVLGMVIQPLIRNPYHGYINPYYWVDDHPLLHGNNGSLDPCAASHVIQLCSFTPSLDLMILRATSNWIKGFQALSACPKKQGFCPGCCCRPCF